METTFPGESLVIEFDAKALAPVALFKARQDIRYYLNGIAVLKHPSGGCLVCGCDGHQLAVWYDPRGKCSADTILNVSPAMIAASRKKMPLNQCHLNPRIVLSDRRLVLQVEGDSLVDEPLELYVQPRSKELIIDGKFPQIGSVLPDPAKLLEGQLGGMNARYVERMAKAAIMLSTFHYSGMYHYSLGVDPGNETDLHYKHGAILTRFDSNRDFIVVTMPLKIGDDRKDKLPPAFDAYRLAWKLSEGAK